MIGSLTLPNTSTIVEDIYNVVKNGAEVTKEQAEQFGKALSDLITERLTKKEKRAFTLRMSNVGKGARQLWYDKQGEAGEELSGATLLKFVLGDIVEALLLFLAGVSGHSVTASQAEVVLRGVKGHIDADIDGVTVDVKSASSHAFKKFRNGTLPEDDAFGYMEQLASYCEARGTDGAFLAMDKQNGTLAYLPFTREELGVYKVEDRIEYLKTALESDTPPERCYPDVEHGKSGNRALGTNCSYCPHKNKCWADANGGLGLRTFMYSTGPVFMTEVVNEPKVFEVSKF